MSITLENAKKKILEKYSDSIINSIMNTPSGYIFNIQPKFWGEKDTLLGGFFKVSKTDGKLTEYSTVMNPAEFREALKNTIYLRRR